MRTKKEGESIMPAKGAPRYEITLIPVDEIKFFVRRSRASAPYARLKESIKEIGLKIPISVRDISSWPRADRRRQEDGGHYKYEVICGQGRLQAFRDLRIDRIPAVVHDIAEVEIVGRFLAENVMRKKLSWVEKAQLIKYDVDVGATPEEIAAKYFISRNHVMKYLRILKGASKAVRELAKNDELSINEAEVLTTLPAEDQDIVVEVLKDEGLSNDSLRPLVDMAKERTKGGKLTKGDLKQRVADMKRERRESRDKLKLYRRIFGYGPAHLQELLEVPEVRSKLDELGVDYGKFLAAANP
jgi:ParB family chromosome partitioning protein